MKLIVTGASGYVGRNLVPLLQRNGHELILVGRDIAKLRKLFPEIRCCNYSQIAEQAKGFSIALHLAVLNNDSGEPIESFRAVNVKGSIATAAALREAGIRILLNFSSTHALDQTNSSFYAISKREAAEELAKIDGIDVITIYLPFVYDSGFSDRLSFLRILPAPLARFTFHIIAALKPTVSVDRIFRFLENDSDYGRAALQHPQIISDGQISNPVFALIKRAFDLGFAFGIALFLWWLLLLIWIAVKVESPGPGFFAQERVGKGGRSFICYKFRTMKAGTANVGTHEVSASSVTKIGHLLRRLKLDELPQIINIFRNEISVVGPRPCLPVQTELIQARRQLGVLNLVPGISGLAQVNGIDMSDPWKLAQWDARYMALQSLTMDLKIFVATALGRGNGDRVVK